MSMFSKILTVFNVLAAIAFLAVAGLDYGKRQTWAYSIFRHELAINGLPLDEKDDSWRPGTPVYRDLTKNTVTDLFKFSGGNPVYTQLEAVAAMKNSVMSAIDSATDEVAQRKAIAAFWLPLLEQLSHREKVMGWIDINSKTKLPVTELKNQLGIVIESVSDDIKSNTSADYRKMRVADLLVNLNPTGDPQLRERAQVIVGLNQYTLAMDRQATNLFAMVGLMQQTVREEQGVFVRQWEELQPRLVVLNEQLKADTARLDQQTKLLEGHNLLYQARRAERDELAEQLRQLGENATAEGGKLAKLQQQLFDLERDLAAARVNNETLEGQIRAKELGQ
jgi:hypothetical protein